MSFGYVVELKREGMGGVSVGGMDGAARVERMRGQFAGGDVARVIFEGLWGKLIGAWAWEWWVSLVTWHRFGGGRLWVVMIWNWCGFYI